MRFSILGCTVLALAACTACSTTPPEPPSEAESESAPAAPAEMPQPTAEAVWSYLEDKNFKSWELWPGKGEFFEGKEPHGALLTNYLNPPAFDAVSNKTGSMPPGAIIVKENYSPEKELMATTVMYKSEGFDSEHNDWFWLKRLADGTVEASGKVASCQKCHGTASGNGYILTGSIK